MGRHGIASPRTSAHPHTARALLRRRPTDVHEITVAGARVLRVGVWRDAEDQPTLVMIAAAWSQGVVSSMLTDRAVTFPIELVRQVKAALRGVEELLERERNAALDASRLAVPEIVPKPGLNS